MKNIVPLSIHDLDKKKGEGAPHPDAVWEFLTPTGGTKRVRVESGGPLAPITAQNDQNPTQRTRTRHNAP